MTTDPGPQDDEGRTSDPLALSIEERIAALEDIVDDLAAAIVEVASGAPTSAAADGDEEVAPPRGWSARASADDWRELAAWVDWLAETYDHQPSRAVLPCWPAHGGAVHELAALRTAWTTAATTDTSDAPGDAMAAWHEGLLRPCLTRLREDYQLRACTDRHVPARLRRQTDPDLLAVALQNAASAVGKDDVYLTSRELGRTAQRTFEP